MGVQLKELLLRRKKRRPRTLMDEAERPLPGGVQRKALPLWSPAQGAAPEEEEEDLFPIMAKASSTFWWN